MYKYSSAFVVSSISKCETAKYTINCLSLDICLSLNMRQPTVRLGAGIGDINLYQRLGVGFGDICLHKRLGVGQGVRLGEGLGDINLYQRLGVGLGDICLYKRLDKR